MDFSHRYNISRFILYYGIFLNRHYSGGRGAKHKRTSPKDATLYFTIRGLSFSKYISKLLHNGVHLINKFNDFNENSPWVTTDASGF